MSPIRVGLIGLTGASPDKYEGTSWTSLAHLPYLTASPDYEVTALLNTSVNSAKAAIERFKLPGETKAYGDAQDLANDKDIDLVVCSVRVDRHFKQVRPSIIAGKTVFAEWPMDANLAIAREMAALAEKHNAKTLIGLQGGYSPVVRKIKELISSGKIGRVLSSNIRGALGNGGKTEGKNTKYFLDREVGGNVVSIHVGHTLESVAAALGEFTITSSTMAINYPTKDIIDRSTSLTLETSKTNQVPDQILIQGVTASNFPISIHWRGGSQPHGTHGLDWIIQGEKGDLKITSAHMFLNTGHADTQISFVDALTGHAEILKTGVKGSEKWINELPQPAQNIARLYEAHRKGEWVPDFAWGVKRHEVIQRLWDEYDTRLKHSRSSSL